MKKISLMVVLILLACFSVSADDLGEKVGSLNVFARSGEYNIIIDNAFAGKTPLKLDNFRAGSHYLKATSGESTVSEQVIEVAQGETTTIVVPISSEVKPEIKYVEVKKSEPEGPDYSEKVSQGYYLVLGYLSSSFYSDGWSSNNTYIDISGSSYNYGVGYKWGLVPHLDLAVEMTRSDFSAQGVNWYMMPLSLNFTYSMAMADKKSKWYYGLGISDMLTDMAVNGSSLGGTAMNFYVGYESPAYKDAVFFEYGFTTGTNSQDISNFLSLFRIGYRWNK
jgi:hypothetical protein